MFSFRQLTSLIAIASLMSVNLLGLVHVGCQDHPACEQSPTAWGLCESVATPVDPHSGHGACGCTHAEPSTESERTDSESEPTDHPHDSDQCSICQAFFASRAAVQAPVAGELIVLPISGQAPTLTADEAYPSPVAGFHSRGPPASV